MINVLFFEGMINELISKAKNILVTFFFNFLQERVKAHICKLLY